MPPGTGHRMLYLDMDTMDIDIFVDDRSQGPAGIQDSRSSYDQTEPSDEGLSSARLSQKTGHMPWRLKNMTALQANVIGQWLEQDYKPSTQQKEEVLDGTSLTMKQLNGCLARARRTCDLSHIADKDNGSVQRSISTESSSKWSDRSRNSQSAGLISDGMPDTRDLGHSRGGYNTTLEWWFETCLSGIGSHLPLQESLRDMECALQSPDPPPDNRALYRSRDTISSWELCSNDGAHISLPESSDHASSPEQNRGAHSGSELSKVLAPYPQVADIVFYYTMCDEFASSKSDSWRRHELQQHVRPPLWICEPAKLNEYGMPICSFCGEQIATRSCIHEVQRCLASNNRAFRRREHLEGHLIRVHKLAASEAKQTSEGFKVDGTINTDINDLTCYFCGDIMSSWDERAKHVAHHFRRERRTKLQWDVLKGVKKGFHT